jgi:hypothetical protein
MKNIFLAVFVVLSGTYHANGQCAVYASKNGSYGYCYKNGEGENVTFDEILQCAQKKCEDNGGTDCEWYLINKKPGWYGIISYKLSNDHIQFVAVGPESSQSDAEKALTDAMNENGGVETIDSKTFQVYSSSKP